MNTTQTIPTAFGSAVVGVLNAKSAEGYDCLSLTVPPKSKRAELTFAPRAEGGIPYVYRKIELNSDLYQPVGWDFAFADEGYVYIRRPLPHLCHVDSKAYLDSDGKELTYLQEKAAEGYMLAAVVEHQYLFVPCPEGEAVTYRLDYGRETCDGACYALPEQVDLDGDWMYFLCASDNDLPVKYYFADIPLSIEEMPPCGDVLIPSELWLEGAVKHMRRKEGFHWIFICLAMVIGAVISNGYFDLWALLVTLALALLMAVSIPFVLARNERKIIKWRLKETGGQVPRVSRFSASFTKPTTEEVLLSPTMYLSPKAQKRSLWMTVLIGLCLALLFTGIAVVGISAGIGSLTAEGFSLAWIMDDFLLFIAGILSVPLALVAYAAVFKTLKHLWSYRKKK